MVMLSLTIEYGIGSYWLSHGWY